MVGIIKKKEQSQEELKKQIAELQGKLKPEEEIESEEDLEVEEEFEEEEPIKQKPQVKRLQAPAPMYEEEQTGITSTEMIMVFKAMFRKVKLENEPLIDRNLGKHNMSFVDVIEETERLKHQITETENILRRKFGLDDITINNIKKSCIDRKTKYGYVPLN